MGYIDPGMSGVVSQLGYIVLFVITSGLLFFLKPLKNGVLRMLERQPAADDTNQKQGTQHD